MVYCIAYINLEYRKVIVDFFQIGMADSLYNKYRVAILIIIIYFILCIRDHVWVSFNYNLLENNAEWPLIPVLLHNLQRFCKFNGNNHVLNVLIDYSLKFQFPVCTITFSRELLWRCRSYLIKFQHFRKRLRNFNLKCKTSNPDYFRKLLCLLYECFTVLEY